MNQTKTTSEIVLKAMYVKLSKNVAVMQNPQPQLITRRKLYFFFHANA